MQFYLKRILKRPFQRYNIVIANNNDALLNKYYQFRYHLYCEVDKLLDIQKYPSKLEFDEYDKYSIHFVALDKKNEIIGVARLIKYSIFNFPTISEFKLSH